MADLGSYPPEFLEAVDLYRRARKRLIALAASYGVRDDGPGRGYFIANSEGAKSTAYNAWKANMEHTYQGQPMRPEVINAALILMLNDRITMVQTSRPPQAQLAMLGTELNKPGFADYTEQAWEAMEEKREQEGAN